MICRVWYHAGSVCVYPAWYAMHHLRNTRKIGRISDSFASSVYVSPAHFSSTHTHANTLCTHWSPHPQLILLHLNQNKQPGGDKPLLFCIHLILLSIILISFLCLTRLLTMSGDQRNPRMVKQPRRSKRGFNSSFSRPILVSRVKTRQLRKCLAGQSKPLTVSFWEIGAWISPE